MDAGHTDLRLDGRLTNTHSSTGHCFYIETCATPAMLSVFYILELQTSLLACFCRDEAIQGHVLAWLRKGFGRFSVVSGADSVLMVECDLNSLAMSSDTHAIYGMFYA